MPANVIRPVAFALAGVVVGGAGVLGWQRLDPVDRPGEDACAMLAEWQTVGDYGRGDRPVDKYDALRVTTHLHYLLIESSRDELRAAATERITDWGLPVADPAEVHAACVRVGYDMPAWSDDWRGD